MPFPFTDMYHKHRPLTKHKLGLLLPHPNVITEKQ